MLARSCARRRQPCLRTLSMFKPCAAHVCNHAAQVPDVDELKAKNAFETSRQLGQAIITTALKEHAGVQPEEQNASAHV